MSTGWHPRVNVARFRDLTLVRFAGQDVTMVVACDSFGGIGAKPNDVIRMEEHELGRKIIRVPLMELMAFGASPILIIDNLGIGMEPGGRRIIEAVRQELTALGLDPEATLNGSTEDNVPTLQTFAGVVALGAISEEAISSRSIEPGDVAICVGKPKSGPRDRIRLDDPEIVKYQDVRALSEAGLTHDMIPVGSHGILYELEQLASSRNRTFTVSEADIDFRKSAGIATCLLVAAASGSVDAIRDAVSAPAVVIGEFK